MTLATPQSIQFPRELRISLAYLSNHSRCNQDDLLIIVAFVRALANQNHDVADEIVRKEWHKEGHGMEDLMKPFRDEIRKEQGEYARTKDRTYDHTASLLAWADRRS